MGRFLNFDTSKDEWSEWSIESWDGQIIDSINEVITNNPSLEFGVFEPESTTPNCPFKNYPCCSPQNTNIEFTDEDGPWGVENGD